MERPRHRLAPMLVVLLLGLVGGAATATGADAQAACEPTNLATQISLFCATDMPTAPCCEPIVASVDLGGGVPCLCRVAAQPQLVLARLNASHLLALYTACGGLRTGGAHLAAACQGPSRPAIPVVAPPPPVAPRHKLPSLYAPPHPATALPSPPPQQQPGGASQGKVVPTQPAVTPFPQVPAAAAKLRRGLVGGSAVTTGADTQTACEPTNLATQIALFCAPDMPTAPCCEAVVASVDLGGGVHCLCRVAAQPQLVLARLNVSHLLALYIACGGLRTGGAHLAATCEGPSPPGALIVAPRLAFPPRRKLPSRDASPPANAQPYPPPQKQPGGASQGKAVLTLPTTPPFQGPDVDFPDPSPADGPFNAPPPPVEPSRCFTRDKFFGCVGNVLSIILFLSPACTVYGFYKNRGVGGQDPDLYWATLFSCSIGLIYAFLSVPPKFLVASINGFGLFVEFLYLVMYLAFAGVKLGRFFIGLGAVVVIFSGSVSVIFLWCTSENTLHCAGVFCSIAGMIMYATQLLVLQKVWHTMNVKDIPAILTLVSIANAICWATFAHMERDSYLWYSNVVGVVVGVVMCAAYALVWYACSPPDGYHTAQQEEEADQDQEDEEAAHGHGHPTSTWRSALATGWASCWGCCWQCGPTSPHVATD